MILQIWTELVWQVDCKQQQSWSSVMLAVFMAVHLSSSLPCSFSNHLDLTWKSWWNLFKPDKLVSSVQWNPQMRPREPWKKACISVLGTWGQWWPAIMMQQRTRQSSHGLLWSTWGQWWQTLACHQETGNAYLCPLSLCLTWAHSCTLLTAGATMTSTMSC